jgi:tartrate dehydratase beta subunit/fumarate hydratase class I family protein
MRAASISTPDPRRSRELEAGRSAAAQRQAADRPRRRAQAHGRHARKGEKLPVDFTNRFIYYVGPVDPVRDEVVGPAGPTTATRMDKFTELMLEQTGLMGMVGKAERGPVGDRGDPQGHQAAYLMAVGGAAYLVSKAIKAARRCSASPTSAWRRSTNSR